MAADSSTPRISASYLSSFVNQTVRILGKITSLRSNNGDTAILDTPGGGPVTITLNRDAHVRVGAWAEVVGKVGGDLSVRALQVVDFGEGIGEYLFFLFVFWALGKEGKRRGGGGSSNWRERTTNKTTINKKKTAITTKKEEHEEDDETNAILPPPLPCKEMSRSRSTLKYTGKRG